MNPDLEAAYAEIDRLTPWEPDDWRRAIAIDFDGVIHDGEIGAKGHRPTGDVHPGALEAIKQLLADGFEVCIHSARLATRQGWEGVEDWLHDEEFPSLPLTIGKPSVAAYLDDRAIRYRDDWSEALRLLRGTSEGANSAR